MASAPQDTLLSRWHMALAARSARVSASEPWHANGNGISSASPTRAAAFFFRSRLYGARLRRLVLVLLSAVLLTVCYLRFSGHDQSQFRVVHGGIRKLSWNSIYLPPQADDNAHAVLEATIPNTVTTEVCVSFPEVLGLNTDTTTMLPHIPAKIWQIYLDFKPAAMSLTYLSSWLTNSPSYAYTVLDAAGAVGVVGRLVGMAVNGSWRVPLYPDTFIQSWESSHIEMSNLAFARDALQQYAAMPRRVLRADFMRYLVLALEGGVYSDIDTSLVRPIRDWVPEKYRSKTRLIVGLEADASPPVFGTKYEVQFCQWTLASSADHPTMWTMLDRILAKVRTLPERPLGKGSDDDDDKEKKEGEDEKNTISKRGKLSDTDVLEITGPAAWTEVVFEHLNQVAGEGVGKERITWQTLTGMEEPRLYGDTLVLPINGFATGVPHSKASKSKTDQTLIKHQFQGQWRDNNG